MTHVVQEKKIPTEREIKKLLLAAKGDKRDIILTCLYTLGRIDEILRLRWDDVNFDHKVVTLWTRKRKDGAYESDLLPMNNDLYAILSKRWKTKRQKTWVFYNPQTDTRYMTRPKMMKSLCTKAKIPHYGFHALRHFMASYLMNQEKIGLKTVSGLLRHKNVKTTETYLHALTQDKVFAMGQTDGKFTHKKAYPQPKAATKKFCNKPLSA
jgi:integrase